VPSEGERRGALTGAQLDRVRVALDATATRISAEPLVGGVDTAAYALHLHGPAGARDVVLRVFRDWEGDASAAVTRAHAALAAVAGVVPLAPRPLLLDAAGELVGDPAMVATHLTGAPQPPPADPEAWIAQLADAMVGVHAVDVARLPADFRSDRPPDEGLARMLAKAPEERDALWDAVAAALTESVGRVRGNRPTLIHGDFWFGNTIWDGARLTGIIDWDGACLGDPAKDVAIARNDLALFISPEAADRFLARYESRRGALVDLRFADLLAALGPIKWLPHWVAGYTELGVELSLARARANLEAWVALLLRSG
jgi:aminoglycoside phosphotransferase (APT) family kinase protein